MQTQSSEPAPEVPSSNFACNLALPGIVLGLGVSVPINGLFRANASSDLGVLHMEGSISLGRFIPSGIRWVGQITTGWQRNQEKMWGWEEACSILHASFRRPSHSSRFLIRVTGLQEQPANPCC